MKTPSRSNSLESSRFEWIRALNKDLLPYGFAYDPRHDAFFATKKPWRRQSGYSSAYNASSFRYNAIFDCESIPFEYDGRKWLIGIRKGQYDVTTGAEIGVYMAAEKDDAVAGSLLDDYYVPINEEYFPHISLSLWKDNSLLFRRSARHWWLTGFSLGRFAHPSELSMHVEITFHESSVSEAFGNALANMGYGLEDYHVNDKSVWLIYQMPHSMQPNSYQSIQTKIRQATNRIHTSLYNKFVPENQSSLEQLAYLKRHSPWFYKAVLHLFHRKKRFFFGNLRPKL